MSACCYEASVNYGTLESLLTTQRKWIYVIVSFFYMTNSYT